MMNQSEFERRLMNWTLATVDGVVNQQLKPLIGWRTPTIGALLELSRQWSQDDTRELLGTLVRNQWSEPQPDSWMKAMLLELDNRSMLRTAQSEGNAQVSRLELRKAVLGCATGVVERRSETSFTYLKHASELEIRTTYDFGSSGYVLKFFQSVRPHASVGREPRIRAMSMVSCLGLGVAGWTYVKPDEVEEVVESLRISEAWTWEFISTLDA